VWCEGVGDTVKEKDIHAEFGRYGKIQDIIIHRVKGQALVWFDQVRTLFLFIHRFCGNEFKFMIFLE